MAAKTLAGVKGTKHTRTPFAPHTTLPIAAGTIAAGGSPAGYLRVRVSLQNHCLGNSFMIFLTSRGPLVFAGSCPFTASSCLPPVSERDRRLMLQR
jgi:hypothetical protein